MNNLTTTTYGHQQRVRSGTGAAAAATTNSDPTSSTAAAGATIGVAGSNTGGTNMVATDPLLARCLAGTAKPNDQNIRFHALIGDPYCLDESDHHHGAAAAASGTNAGTGGGVVNPMNHCHSSMSLPMRGPPQTQHCPNNQDQAQQQAATVLIGYFPTGHLQTSAVHSAQSKYSTAASSFNHHHQHQQQQQQQHLMVDDSVSNWIRLPCQSSYYGSQAGAVAAVAPMHHRQQQQHHHHQLAPQQQQLHHTQRTKLFGTTNRLLAESAQNSLLHHHHHHQQQQQHLPHHASAAPQHLQLVQLERLSSSCAAATESSSNAANSMRAANEEFDWFMRHCNPGGAGGNNINNNTNPNNNNPTATTGTNDLPVTTSSNRPQQQSLGNEHDANVINDPSSSSSFDQFYLTSAANSLTSNANQHLHHHRLNNNHQQQQQQQQQLPRNQSQQSAEIVDHRRHEPRLPIISAGTKRSADNDASQCSGDLSADDSAEDQDCGEVRLKLMLDSQQDELSSNSLLSRRNSQDFSTSPISDRDKRKSIYDDSSANGRVRNSETYFWQYNVQAKGPKTKRTLHLKNKDPHVPRAFFDPVCQMKAKMGSRGSATAATSPKLRKGDGNDVTPNPQKLMMLGLQIKQLTEASYRMTPSGTNHKESLKREKNKLASRSCRLKKKAQHEANKLKLQGLNEEHGALLAAIKKVRAMIYNYFTCNLMATTTSPVSPNSYKPSSVFNEIVSSTYCIHVAGNTDRYVSHLLESLPRPRGEQMSEFNLIEHHHPHHHHHHHHPHHQPSQQQQQQQQPSQQHCGF